MEKICICNLYIFLTHILLWLYEASLSPEIFKPLKDLTCSNGSFLFMSFFGIKMFEKKSVPFSLFCSTLVDAIPHSSVVPGEKRNVGELCFTHRLSHLYCSRGAFIWGAPLVAWWQRTACQCRKL